MIIFSFLQFKCVFVPLKLQPPIELQTQTYWTIHCNCDVEIVLPRNRKMISDKYAATVLWSNLNSQSLIIKHLINKDI